MNLSNRLSKLEHASLRVSRTAEEQNCSRQRLWDMLELMAVRIGDSVPDDEWRRKSSTAEFAAMALVEICYGRSTKPFWETIREHAQSGSSSAALFTGLLNMKEGNAQNGTQT